MTKRIVRENPLSYNTSMAHDSNTNLSYRVECLERKYEQLDGKIDQIMVNHLPHIFQEIISLKTRVNVQTVINVGAIIVGLLISKYLG